MTKLVYVCKDCGQKLPEPTTPLKWCLYCFSSDLVPLTEVNSRVFPNGQIYEGKLTLEYNRDGLFLSAEGERRDLKFTREDINLLYRELVLASDYYAGREKERNQNIEINRMVESRKAQPKDASNAEGFIYVGFGESVGDFTVGLAKNPIAKSNYAYWSVVYQFPTDNMGEGVLKLHKALATYRNTELDVIINYIVTIRGYYAGEFLFKEAKGNQCLFWVQN